MNVRWTRAEDLDEKLVCAESLEIHSRFTRDSRSVTARTNGVSDLNLTSNNTDRCESLLRHVLLGSQKVELWISEETRSDQLESRNRVRPRLVEQLVPIRVPIRMPIRV